MKALVPFPGLAAPAGVRVAAEARREGTRLHLRWHLDDPEGAVAIPDPAPAERRYALWDATCFEAFVAADGPGYWELNLSPAGDWNLYRLDGYREGLRPEPRVAALQTAIAHRVGGCDAEATLDLTALGAADHTWHVALAIVIAEPSGHHTFWALSHPAAEPDFHHADARALRLPVAGFGA